MNANQSLSETASDSSSLSEQKRNSPSSSASSLTSNDGLNESNQAILVDNQEKLAESIEIWYIEKDVFFVYCNLPKFEKFQSLFFKVKASRKDVSYIFHDISLKAIAETFAVKGQEYQEYEEYERMLSETLGVNYYKKFPVLDLSHKESKYCDNSIVLSDTTNEEELMGEKEAGSTAQDEDFIHDNDITQSPITPFSDSDVEEFANKLFGLLNEKKSFMEMMQEKQKINERFLRGFGSLCSDMSMFLDYERKPELKSTSTVSFASRQLSFISKLLVDLHLPYRQKVKTVLSCTDNCVEYGTAKPSGEVYDLNLNVEYKLFDFKKTSYVKDWAKAINIPRLRIQRQLFEMGVGIVIDPIHIRIFTMAHKAESIGLQKLKFDARGLCVIFGTILKLANPENLNSFFI